VSGRNADNADNDDRRFHPPAAVEPRPARSPPKAKVGPTTKAIIVNYFPPLRAAAHHLQTVGSNRRPAPFAGRFSSAPVNEVTVNPCTNNAELLATSTL
jgi:hypothetical protein